MKDHCIKGPSGTPAAAAPRPVRATHSRGVILAASALLVLLGLSLLPAAGGRAVAGQAPAGRKVLLVLIDRIGIDDLGPLNSPNMLKLAETGDMSLMNARIKYDQYGLGSYLVIGAGGRTIGGMNIGLAFNSTERLRNSDGTSVAAGSVYRSRTGRLAPDGSAVNLYIEEMKTKSDVPQASSTPGLMGETLRAGCKAVAVLGNADSDIPSSPVDIPSVLDQRPQQQPADVEFVPPGQTTTAPAQGQYPLTSFIHREYVAIAMDSFGKVSSGNVSDELTLGSLANGDLRTDFARLEAQTGAALASSDVVVVDMGQTSRVDEQADFYTESRLAAARGKALRQCDASLGRLASMMDPGKDLIVVCTPTPTRKMIEDGKLITPLVLSGPGFSSGGQLHSATTRRTGLVSNYDIAPTIIDFEGLKAPAEMDGRPVTATGTRMDISALRRFQNRAAATFNARRLMVRIYVIASMCIIALFFLIILLRRDLIDGHPYFWSLPLLAVLSGPLMWLIAPVFGALPPAGLVAVSLGGAILIALAALALRQKSGLADSPPLSSSLLPSILVISGGTLLLILIDLLAGSPLITFSTFGSDTILGDRYYGIGNLYMGFAIGAGVIVACLAVHLLDRLLDKPWKKYGVAGVVLAVTVIFIGSPSLGANVGGIVAAVVASLVTLFKLSGKPMTWKKVALVVAVLVLCVGAVFAIDALMPGTASHAGKAVGKLKSSGLSALAAQAARKLATNWMLTWTSIWRLLLLFGAVAWLVFNWKFKILEAVKREYTYLYAGFVGLAVGLLVAWIFNDSGIEAAAAISVFLFVPYFLLLIPWVRKQAAPPETG